VTISLLAAAIVHATHMQVLLFDCIQDTGQGGLLHRAVIRPCFDEGVMHQQCAVMAIILTKHARKASACDNVQ
jgi:hypothetical protein